MATIEEIINRARYGSVEEYAEALNSADAEVERLTAQLIEAEKYNGYHQLACLEIERLRAALKEIEMLGMESDDIQARWAGDIATKALNQQKRNET